MLSQERYQAILNLVNEKNSVTVAQLAQMLETSESTIRRDLTALDELGKLRKVFGGATSIRQNPGIFEDAVSSRETVMSKEKTEIARYCAQTINDHDFVYIDAGTTTSRLIDFIENKRATYVTNGIAHGRKLIQRGLDAHIIGGKIKAVTEAVIGASAMNGLKNLNFSKAFIGTNGIDLEAGFTTPDIEEALMKQAAIESSYIAYVLADNSKFRRVFPVTFSPLKKCCIITDLVPDNRYMDETVIKEVSK